MERSTMNREVRDAWVAALTSGEYRQGTGVLHRVQNGEHTWCCLGVLCDLALKAGVEMAVVKDAAGGGGEKYTYDEEPFGLPEAVLRWAGLPTMESTEPLSKERETIGNVILTERIATYNPDPGTAIYYNDAGMAPFTEIAELIWALPVHEEDGAQESQETQS